MLAVWGSLFIIFLVQSQELDKDEEGWSNCCYLCPRFQQYHGIEGGADTVDNVMMSEEDEAIMMDGMEDAV